jgi:prevent-host-death family protein
MVILYRTEGAMISKTVTETRETLADLVGRVQYGGEQVAITKHGKVVAALVSAADLKLLEELEDRWLVKLVEEREADPDYDPNDTVPAEEVFARLLSDETLE